MGKNQQVRETPAQIALAETLRARMAEWTTRLQPLQRLNEQRIATAGKANSFERRRARGMVATDNAASFGGAAVKTVATQAATGQLGQAGSKLALTGMSDDQATSGGLAAVAAEQSRDDAMIQGKQQVVALGNGQDRAAMDNMGALARQSGQQAQFDAELSARRRAGNAQLVGTGIGAGVGMLKGSVPGYDGEEGFDLDGAGRRINNPSAYTP